MVSISTTASEAALLEGLSDTDAERVIAALEYVTPLYANKCVVTEQNALQFISGVVATLAMLRTDVDTRIAAILFELPELNPIAAEQIEIRFGKEIADLVTGIRRLMKLREAALTQRDVGRGKDAAEKAATQMETLRKMVLAMATDMRVVLVRLASRVTTLRYFAECKREDGAAQQYASETMDLYAPLANRLGVWQLKWELEDLSFRFLEPQQYKRIAKMLEEKRLERESFVVNAIARLNKELQATGVKAEVTGRPKHIYSIWKKMKGKSVDFDELYDVRAFRVIVDDIKDCYTVLGIVHNAWTPIPKEFDDYISRPKPNGYKSLHTVVVVEDGRPLEVQIRTREMHQFAEYGVAAHWRYKESGGSNFSAQEYDEKIAWLRQLLAWKTDVADVVVEQEELQREWVEKLKAASLDDRIYVLTPQARVIELPSNSTPVDFAYHLHTDVGHRCRGARVDNVMVPLNTPLKNGQTVEIITLKVGSPQTGPSRDWLTSEYSASTRTRTKIRAWFNTIDQEETLSSGRALVEKTLQREGKTAVNLEELARKLGFAEVNELFLSVGKDEFSLRQIETVLRENVAEHEPDEVSFTNKSRASSVTQGAKSGVLVVGTEGLMTQLARCCKPAPPDDIVGFVTRGKGISIHRLSCKNFAEMRNKAPERVIQTTWGEHGKDTVYPVDIFVLAQDRQGLLRDISEVFSREKINVIGVNTQSAKSQARMSFTVEIGGTTQLQKALTVLHEVSGVLEVRRN
ncbi:bifunctional (p)ppGpp synthetase/guanosine-3',5'-bis(diphosphate) 3'-pyrophosphohydrolase [Undibacterium sp. CY18W]|uniref:GTP pyrophosphokinase n=1 Tax=Undibacterium hunanense TaxID=2762292 RepID=A0ABR6ZW08_9BURK|nr:bifunctional (p)ppGpp synthetase/guanosine-3',5'-bis(diphosphate) 3'-pyrophosphohydrolase [Undibacterium hunanense]MBC3919808.1 bifunctional (p)ppGpp synthetase/guanosine-3',5'-bis(diphosphate) 3'-pyrophosphohydrolase [Undibacterium hunanense]